PTRAKGAGIARPSGGRRAGLLCGRWVFRRAVAAGGIPAPRALFLPLIKTCAPPAARMRAPRPVPAGHDHEPALAVAVELGGATGAPPRPAPQFTGVKAAPMPKTTLFVAVVEE